MRLYRPGWNHCCLLVLRFIIQPNWDDLGRQEEVDMAVGMGRPWALIMVVELRSITTLSNYVCDRLQI